MKKRWIFIILVVFLILSSNSVSAYSWAEEFSDNIKLFFARGDKKVETALQIREKEINSAIDNIASGNTIKAINDLEDAKEKLKVVQEEVSPEIANDIILNIQDVMGKIIESEDIDPGFSSYLEEHLSEEQKTQLAAQLSKRIYNLCRELASQDFMLMLEEPKCNPDDAPAWLKDKIEDEFKELQEIATQNMIDMLTTCINDPRECDCSGIPVKAGRAECEKNTALAIKCEFREDISACDELEKIGPPKAPEDIPDFLKPIFERTIKSLLEEKEKEMFKKFAPRECIEAGVTTREECEEIMIEKYGEPPEECMEDGRFIGEDECIERMIEAGNIPQECIRDGNFIGKEECEQVMIGEAPLECIREGEFVGEEECMRIMIESGKIPEQCIENGEFIGREECEELMMELGPEAPPECVREGEFVGGEECEKMMIESKEIPEQCVEDGQFIGREECEKIMEEKAKEVLVINEFGEQEYISEEEIDELIEKSERNAEEFQPSLERAEEIKEDIENIEGNIEEIEETRTRIEIELDLPEEEFREIEEEEEEVEEEEIEERKEESGEGESESKSEVEAEGEGESNNEGEGESETTGEIVRNVPSFDTFILDFFENIRSLFY